MATIVRGTKSNGGGTNFAAGTILASEVNTDFNNIVNDYNGNITNANVAAAAAIETSKIDDHSDGTEVTTETNPGTSISVSAATTLAVEIEQLRYKIKQIGLGTSVKRLDGTAGVDLVSWYDTPAVGPNLIRNGNFAVKTTAAGSAPDGWTIVGTPSTLTVGTVGVTEGQVNARGVRIIASGVATVEGIQQTLAGLKANTLYQVGCRLRVTTATHTAQLVTTGATNGSGGTFDDLALSRTGSTAFTTLSGVILTDGTPTDIVVQLLTSASAGFADDFMVTHVWVRECNTDPIPLSNTAWAYNEITTNTADFYGSSSLVDSGLTVNVVTPGPGYIIEVACKMTTQSFNNAGALAAVFVLYENAVEVDCDYVYLDSNSARDRGTCKFNYVNSAPVAGTTYTYTVSGSGLGDNVDLNAAATAVAETPKSWIRCRAVLESGGH